jgi:hypothetical protein
MLLPGHIVEDDFKSDFRNYVSTNVEYARMQYDACSGIERGVCLLYDNSEHVPSSSPHDNSEFPHLHLTTHSTAEAMT